MASKKQKFDKEHEIYIQGKIAGKHDLEIMRDLGWSSPIMRRHQARAYEDGIDSFKNPNEIVIYLSDMPENIINFFNSPKEDALIKFMRAPNSGNISVEIF